MDEAEGMGVRTHVLKNVTPVHVVHVQLRLRVRVTVGQKLELCVVELPNSSKYYLFSVLLIRTLFELED